MPLPEYTKMVLDELKRTNARIDEISKIITSVENRLNQRIDLLYKKIEEVEAKFKKKINEAFERIQVLQAEVNEKLDLFEQYFDRKIDGLNKKIEEIRRKNRLPSEQRESDGNNRFFILDNSFACIFVDDTWDADKFNLLLSQLQDCDKDRKTNKFKYIDFRVPRHLYHWTVENVERWGFKQYWKCQIIKVNRYKKVV